MGIKKLLFRLLFILIYLTLSNTAYSSGISVSQVISHNEIAFEDSVNFEILLTWDGSPAVYLFDKPLKPYIDRLKVRGFTSSISSKLINNKEISTKRFIYTLIPTSSGQGTIDSISISYINRLDSIPGELMTEPMAITIANPLPEETQKTTSYLFWSVLIACLLIIGGGIYFLKMKKAEPKEKKLSPTETVLEALTQVKQSAGSNLKIFQTGVYNILSKYIKTEYNIDLANLDHEQLIEKLKTTNMSDSEINKISAWIVQAEKDKYSPLSSTPGDTIRLESEIRQLFDKK